MNTYIFYYVFENLEQQLPVQYFDNVVVDDFPVATIYESVWRGGNRSLDLLTFAGVHNMAFLQMRYSRINFLQLHMQSILNIS